MSTDLIGQHIQNYRVLRRLGQGGMGAVFEAVHEGIGRHAAIKVLHQHLAQDQQLLERFFNEARTVNLILHPGIVQVHEMGTLPDGTAYIIMEYLDGQTLGARMKAQGGRLPPQLAARLCRQIASALHAAHGCGVIHRDLKPENVMLVPDPDLPDGERIKVLDFGIAKVAPAQRHGDLRTMTGAMMGTPVYMAPEQCRGAGLVNEKADVYALGVMLFQMVAGRPPFFAEGMGEILGMHLFRPPPHLSDVARELGAPPPSPELDALVGRMLDKDPAARPDMAEVAAQLRTLGEETHPATPPQLDSAQPRGQDASVPPVGTPRSVPPQSLPSLAQHSVPPVSLAQHSVPPQPARSRWREVTLAAVSGFFLVGGVALVAVLRGRGGQPADVVDLRPPTDLRAPADLFVAPPPADLRPPPPANPPRQDPEAGKQRRVRKERATEAQAPAPRPEIKPEIKPAPPKEKKPSDVDENEQIILVH